MEHQYLRSSILLENSSVGSGALENTHVLFFHRKHYGYISFLVFFLYSMCKCYFYQICQESCIVLSLVDQPFCAQSKEMAVETLSLLQNL